MVAQYRLRFRVPTVRPDLYQFVIWGPGGMLITDNRPRHLLEVPTDQAPAASSGSGTNAALFIAGAVALVMVGGAGVLLRRRRTA